MVYESYSPEDTFNIAGSISKKCKPGSIVCLSGDLGVGKTVFAKGFGKGLGIEEPINSPTYTIMQIYDSGKMPLYHFDVYRIGDVSEMEDIGYLEYFYGEGVCLIEWSELIVEILPIDRIKIKIEKALDKGYEYRKITVENDPQICVME